MAVRMVAGCMQGDKNDAVAQRGARGRRVRLQQRKEPDALRTLPPEVCSF